MVLRLFNKDNSLDLLAQLYYYGDEKNINPIISTNSSIGKRSTIIQSKCNAFQRG